MRRLCSGRLYADARFQLAKAHGGRSRRRARRLAQRRDEADADHARHLVRLAVTIRGLAPFHSSRTTTFWRAPRISASCMTLRRARLPRGYKAGPARYEHYLATSRPLPAETQAYVAAITPSLRDGGPAPGNIITVNFRSLTDAALFPARSSDSPTVPPPSSDGVSKQREVAASAADWTGLVPQSEGLFARLWVHGPKPRAAFGPIGVWRASEHVWMWGLGREDDRPTDGKIKGRPSIWRILLNALGFLDSRRIPRAVASSRKLNDINAPSASRLQPPNG